jgi:CRISPR-associated exonuclease Cas4
MFTEDELLPISALQHLLFCERQTALIHLEQVWVENGFTAEGRVLHERVDVEHHESRKSFRQEFGMALRCLQHGLIGKADLVECWLGPGSGVVKAVPVEFKRGSDKENDCDRVQLCAQALCLEEMLGITVPIGQFYYLRDHRRTTVEIDANLRQRTLDAAGQFRAIIQGTSTPIAVYEKKKCEPCSLIDLCLPKSAGQGGKRVARYIELQLRAARAECQLEG